MGSFPSMMESGGGAGVHPHPPAGRSTATPSPPPGSNQMNLQSPLNSGQTNGRGEGTVASSRSGNLARVRSRALLMKRLLKGRILFLGLDGAGKTTLIQQLLRQSSIDASEEDDEVFAQCMNPGDMSSRSTLMQGSTRGNNMLVSSSSNGDLSISDDKLPKLYPDPTKATHSVAYRLEPERFVQLVDVPGGRKYRSARWRAALQGESSFQDLPTATATGAPISYANVPIVGVVFVVDASDQTRFPLVAQELVKVQKLRDQHQNHQRTPSSASSALSQALQRAPFFLVLNKVDLTASNNNNNEPNDQQIQERRRASRQLRQELKKAFDHQLRMDQKRHPHDYAATVAAGGEPPSSNQPAAPSSKKQALAEANNNRKTMLMTSIAECCAFDRDSVRSLHGWLRDEVRRLWAS